ncbi:uncharacterized protein LOC116607005 isoform X2 [Nematostella vectensis]|nr:uncharacterized protein LOC116607005 isoform X2 [Nematostella vectensis]
MRERMAKLLSKAPRHSKLRGDGSLHFAKGRKRGYLRRLKVTQIRNRETSQSLLTMTRSNEVTKEMEKIKRFKKVPIGVMKHRNADIAKDKHLHMSQENNISRKNKFNLQVERTTKENIKPPFGGTSFLLVVPNKENYTNGKHKFLDAAYSLNSTSNVISKGHRVLLIRGKTESSQHAIAPTRRVPTILTHKSFAVLNTYNNVLKKIRTGDASNYDSQRIKFPSIPAFPRRFRGVQEVLEHTKKTQADPTTIPKSSKHEKTRILTRSHDQLLHLKAFPTSLVDKVNKRVHPAVSSNVKDRTPGIPHRDKPTTGTATLKIFFGKQSAHLDGKQRGRVFRRSGNSDSEKSSDKDMSDSLNGKEKRQEEPVDPRLQLAILEFQKKSLEEEERKIEKELKRGDTLDKSSRDYHIHERIAELERWRQMATGREKPALHPQAINMKGADGRIHHKERLDRNGGWSKADDVTDDSKETSEMDNDILKDAQNEKGNFGQGEGTNRGWNDFVDGQDEESTKGHGNTNRGWNDFVDGQDEESIKGHGNTNSDNLKGIDNSTHEVSEDSPVGVGDRIQGQPNEGKKATLTLGYMLAKISLNGNSSSSTSRPKMSSGEKVKVIHNQGSDLGKEFVPEVRKPSEPGNEHGLEAESHMLIDDGFLSRVQQLEKRVIDAQSKVSSELSAMEQEMAEKLDALHVDINTAKTLAGSMGHAITDRVNGVLNRAKQLELKSKERLQKIKVKAQVLDAIENNVGADVTRKAARVLRTSIPRSGSGNSYSVMATTIPTSSSATSDSSSPHPAMRTSSFTISGNPSPAIRSTPDRQRRTYQQILAMNNIITKIDGAKILALNDANTTYENRAEVTKSIADDADSIISELASTENELALDTSVELQDEQQAKSKLRDAAFRNYQAARKTTQALKRIEKYLRKLGKNEKKLREISKPALTRTGEGNA